MPRPESISKHQKSLVKIPAKSICSALPIDNTITRFRQLKALHPCYTPCHVFSCILLTGILFDQLLSHFQAVFSKEYSRCNGVLKYYKDNMYLYLWYRYLVVRYSATSIKSMKSRLAFWEDENWNFFDCIMNAISTKRCEWFYRFINLFVS